MRSRRRNSNDDDRPARNRRTVTSVMGPEGHGKTDFWTTAKKPIACINVDPNTSAVLEKLGYRDDDEETINVHYVDMPLVGFEPDEEKVKEQAEEAWEKLTDFLRPIIMQEADPMPATVVLDTGTELNDLNILSGFGRTDKIAPKLRLIAMGKINAQFKGIFRGLEHAGVHVVVAHRCREVWVTEEIKHGPRKGEEHDRKVPGEWERVGFKQMGNMTNIEVLAMFDPTREGKLSNKFGMRVTRCTLRPGIIRKEYWGRERQEDGSRVRRASWPYLMMQVYPGTTLEDWT